MKYYSRALNGRRRIITIYVEAGVFYGMHACFHREDAEGENWNYTYRHITPSSAARARAAQDALVRKYVALEWKL